MFSLLYALKLERDREDQLYPKRMRFTSKGKRRFIKFFNKHNKEQKGLSGCEAAAWSKLEAYAVRLAMLIQLLRHPESIEVDAKSVAAAIKLVDWFKHETRRIYAVLVESDEESNQRELVELIRRKDGSITARDLMQAKRQYRGDAEQARAALSKLADQGLGHWETVPPSKKGGRAKQHFVLLPSGGGGG